MPASAETKAARDDAWTRRAAQRLAVLFGALVFLPLVSLSTCVLLFVGMLPTTVAFLIDRTSGRFATAAVGGLNFAGVVPFVFELWFDRPGMTGAVAILTDPFALVTMYAAAALGWGLVVGLPAAFGFIDDRNIRNRIARLKARQRELVEEWGAEVVGAEPEPDGEATATEAERPAAAARQ